MNGDAIEYRALAAEDHGAVVALWQRCEGVEVAEGDDEASFRGYLRRNPGLSCCATVGGKIVGAALCGHDGRRGLVYHLAVDGAFRGRGIAKEILRRGIEGLRREGIARVLILVAKDNAPAREFWIARGFEEIAAALPLGLDLA